MLRKRSMILKAGFIVALAGWRLAHPASSFAAVLTPCDVVFCNEDCFNAPSDCASIGCAGWSCGGGAPYCGNNNVAVYCSEYGKS